MAKVNEQRFSAYLTDFGFRNDEASYLLQALQSSRGPMDMVNYTFSYFSSDRANLVMEILAHSQEGEK